MIDILLVFFLDSRFRNKPLKKSAYIRIVRCITTIEKRLKFNFDESKALCEQIRDYKNFKEPFNLDIACALDDFKNW